MKSEELDVRVSKLFRHASALVKELSEALDDETPITHGVVLGLLIAIADTLETSSAMTSAQVTAEHANAVRSGSPATAAAFTCPDCKGAGYVAGYVCAYCDGVGA